MRWQTVTHERGKWRGNWRMEWVASTLHTTTEHGVSSITTADAHISAASSRLNWRLRRADLKGLVRFAERRNLVSARVPSHFKRSLQVLTPQAAAGALEIMFITVSLFSIKISATFLRNLLPDIHPLLSVTNTRNFTFLILFDVCETVQHYDNDVSKQQDAKISVYWSF